MLIPVYELTKRMKQNHKAFVINNNIQIYTQYNVNIEKTLHKRFDKISDEMQINSVMFRQ